MVFTFVLQLKYKINKSNLGYNDHMTVTDLRQKYPVFTYQSANWQIEGNQFQASFAFSAGKHMFHHQIAFACDQKKLENCDQSMISQLVFSLGMVEMLSYWKAFCSPVIQLEAGGLSAKQIEWWQKLLINGMGEYFYVNQIDFTGKDFVKIAAPDQNTHNSGTANYPADHSTPDHDELTQPAAFDPNQQPTFLIPIGGGKDSIITLEILKNYVQQTNARSSEDQIQTYPSDNPQQPSNHQLPTKHSLVTNSQSLKSGQPTISHQPPASSPLTILLVNPTQAARDIANQANLPTIIVNRQIDSHLFDLNQQSYLNGHVPFSASLAFISVLIAYLYQINIIALSNEASANEASLTYLDRSINHQYSKSFEFERDFREYLTKLLTSYDQQPMNPDGTLKQVQGDEVISTYFSILRPLNELQIARLFAKLGQPYFSVFRSCNRGSKTNTWCGDCPKCLFAYLMLAPWLNESTMVNIFGQNLLQKVDLEPTLLALIGATPDKPLECIGLRDESLVACHLIIKQYQDARLQLPILLSQILSEIDKQSNLPYKSRRLLNDWNDQHCLPKSLSQLISATLPDDK